MCFIFAEAEHWRRDHVMNVILTTSLNISNAVEDSKKGHIKLLIIFFFQFHRFYPTFPTPFSKVNAL